MTAPLLVPDLALERWPSMDRYAAELALRIPGLQVPGEAAALRGPRFVSRYLRYPHALRRYRPSLVHIADHSYAHCLRAFPGTPSVVTIHDLYPVHVLASRTPGWRAAARAVALRYVLAWLRRATRWIAVSAFTAREAQALLGLPADRVTVVRPGVDEAFFLAPDPGRVAAVREGWLARTGGARSGDPRVVLHVGSCVARKHVEAAFGALADLRREGLDARFVQVGGRFGPAHARAIAAAGIARAVIQVEHAPEAELLTAYHAADVLVLPSTYEGFGLPAIEAQAAGLPVVASGAGGLPEAVGDAGLIVDAPEPAALADALRRVLSDEALRSRLVASGRVHARTFSWDATAAAVRRLYADLGA